MIQLSIIVLTLNEAHNIVACIRSLTAQTRQGFETIIIDAASDDGTVELAREAAKELAGPVQVHGDRERLPIGRARNMGVAMAKGKHLAFLSADAELDPHWVERALLGLEEAALVFGRQVHAPHAWTTAAAVRGLRYHFPEDASGDPLVLASNVAAAYHRTVLERFPFDDDTNAAEDLVLARLAVDAGFRAVYDPAMVVFHHDVTSAREELRKNVREGQGCAAYRNTIGISRSWLLWGGALALGAVAAAVAPGPRGLWLAVFGGLLWAPAVRRAMKRRSAIPFRPLVSAVGVTPFYDLAFFGNYVVGLLRAPEDA